jgi:methionine-gamma-lyase
MFPRFGVDVDVRRTPRRAGEIEKAMRPETRLVYVETPANPTVEITDLARAAEIGPRRTGRCSAWTTPSAAPCLQRPLEHGCRHRAPQHDEVPERPRGRGRRACWWRRNEASFAKLRPVVTSFGGTMDPHQAWLVLRGLKSLPMRVDRGQQNAMAIATMLEESDKVEWVRYPGLPSHPAHELAQRQMDGPGALISFELKGGFEAGRTLLDSVKLMILAVSLGGIETLIQHPASMTHAGMSKEAREKAGITDGLVRLSVGCEDLDDLQRDLEQALARV